MMKQSVRCRFLLITLLFSLLMIIDVTGLVYAYGQTENSGEESWSYVLYNNNNGMPFSEANALAQTQDGFLYIGSFGGLLRYDGEDFYQYDDYRLQNVMDLYADSRDRLWIATNSNGFCVMEKGVFSFYGEEEGIPAKFVRCFAEDAAGNILIGTVEGLYYMNPENEFCKLSDSYLDKSIISVLHRDNKGRIYGLTKNSDLFIIEDLKLTSWYGGGAVIHESLNCIYPDPQNEGYLYMGLEESGLLYGDPSKGEESFVRIDTPGLAYINWILYVDGRLWIVSDKGIAFLDKDGRYVRPDRMQKSDTCNSLLADMEGNIWVASDRLGVIKLSLSIFTNINSLANLESRVVNTTYCKDGILYIGSDEGLICLDEKYQPIRTPVSDLLAKERIRCIREDSRDTLWISTYGACGLVSMQPDGSIRTYTMDDGLVSNSVRETLEMSDGRIAVSQKGGICFIRDGEIVQCLTERDGLPNPQILAMCEYEDGRLLLATNGDGIYSVEEDGIKPFPLSSELKSGVVLRINADAQRRCWWLLTGNGIYVLKDGELTEVPGFPNLHNYDIVFDQKGNAWVFSGDGIYIGNAEDMMAGETIHYIHYNYKSGLPFVVTAHSRNYFSDDGMFYMAGGEGVVRINTGQRKEDVSDVRLSVPYVEVDEETVFLSPGEKLVIPYNTKRIWVHAFAPSYSINEPVLSYGLEGFDEGMSIFSRSTLPSIIYTNLRGGSYVFRFALIDPITGETEKEIAVPIVKKKAIYEYIFFWLLVLTGVLALTMLNAKMYVRKKRKEMEKEREQDRIRTELAVGSDIQAAMLPREFPAFPDRKEFDLYASMDPAKEVAGDFYDYFLTDPDHLALIMADVSGKGVGAALLMMAAKIILKTSATSGQFSGPGEILRDANNKLCEGNEASMFVTAWLGILTISTGELITANAGHEYPVFFRSGEGFELVKDKHGLALGAMEGARYREACWTLNPGDGLFVYTDGVPEATNDREEMFGNDRMLAALNRCIGQNPQGILKGVREDVDAFVGDAPQFDDLTMMAFLYYGA